MLFRSQGDGTKATIYYTAEDRIDFRGIVRTMADRFKVRVEMKQIGARDRKRVASAASAVAGANCAAAPGLPISAA